MDIVLDFLENTALLTLIGMGCYFIESNQQRLGGLGSQVAVGLVFGALAFLVTATPITFPDGATLDARAGPVLLAGVFGGPIGAVLAAMLGALARGIIGGNFAFSGVAVYIVYAGMGLALAQTRLVRRDTILQPFVIAILSVSACLGAAAMFFLIQPQERAMAWLVNDLPWIFVANILSVAYCAVMIGLASAFVRTAQDVRNLNERLDLAKRALGFGTWDYNLETGRLEWDARSAELHGLDPTELDGALEHWLQYINPDDLPRTEEKFQAALENDEPFSNEYRVNLPNADTRVIKGDALVVRDRKGAPVRVVGANLDLTDLRNTQANLVEARSIAMQAQKFETIGKMTGGLAHDFNNLLAVIMGNQELLRDVIEGPDLDRDDANELIEASLQATRRGADLTQNLLAYARQAQLKPEPLDLNLVVRQTEAWLRRTIESRIEIESVLQAGIWTVEVDRASLQSALVNLLINARDALGGPGKVTIETANVRIDPAYVDQRAEDIAPGRYVMLAVSDNGPGIPPDALDDIFDPFFTTKPVGEGTGLGLSMVQGFVKQSRGAVRVYSEEGMGASFKLYFPVSEDTAQDAPSANAPKTYENASALDQRILLVEDQEELLAVLEQILTTAGYSVMTATSGDRAFEIFLNDPKRFDLVATDIVMPGALQGPALAKSIRKTAPDMPFVFFSGYAREAVLHGNGLRASDISLMKPVARQDLLEAVKAALNLKSE